LFRAHRNYTLAPEPETPERLLKALFKRIVTKIMRQARRMTLSKGVIARSMAMGMVVGFSPTVGLQMVICLILILIVNRLAGRYLFDIVVSVVGTLVVNPLTMVPTYTLYYVIGCRAVTCSTVVEFQSEQQVHQMLTTLGDGALAIFIGSLPFMIVGGPVGYWIGRGIERFLERRVERRQARQVQMAKRRRDARPQQTVVENG
jgi:uncharacterized protein (DUF2062 family)